LEYREPTRERAMADILQRVKSLFTDPSPKPTEPNAAPDGTKETLRSGIWAAGHPIPEACWPGELILTAADKSLSRKVKDSVVLAKQKMGAHVVEMLLERGEDKTIDLALRIPTAENQFKD